MHLLSIARYIFYLARFYHFVNKFISGFELGDYYETFLHFSLLIRISAATMINVRRHHPGGGNQVGVEVKKYS